jgi:hypothetical protein
MKITINQLRSLIKEEVRKVNEINGLPIQTIFR